MKFIIGQKVRFTHQKGEGVITKIIDKNTVEVDTGDDFPMDFDLREITAIDSREAILLPTSERKEEEERAAPVRLGIHLMELSLVLSISGPEHYDLWIANPEKWTILWLSYLKVKGKFLPLNGGKVKSNHFEWVARVSKDELGMSKEFFWQFLQYTEQAGIPQSPSEKVLIWDAATLSKEPIYSELFEKDVWIYSLREEIRKPKPVFEDAKTVFVSKDVPEVTGGTHIVDLHIEKLTPDWRELNASEMLFMQIDAFHRAISDALLLHASSLVLIHGIGEGKLKSKIHSELLQHGKIKSFFPADSLKYGNGATEVFFQ